MNRLGLLIVPMMTLLTSDDDATAAGGTAANVDIPAQATGWLMRLDGTDRPFELPGLMTRRECVRI